MLGQAGVGEWWREVGEQRLGRVGGQIGFLAKDIALGLSRHYQDFGDYSDGRAKLEDAYDLLGRLQRAVNPFVSEYAESAREAARPLVAQDIRWKVPETMVWTYPGKFAIKPKSYGWPVHREELEEVAQEYVRNYLGISQEFEKILVSALAYVEVHGFSESRESLAESIAELSPFWAKRGFLAGLRLAFRCLVALLLGILAAAQGGADIGLVVAAGAYILLGINASVAALAAEVPTINAKLKSTRLLADMLNVSRQTSDPLMPPSMIRRLLEKTTDDGAVWPSALWSLVLAAEQRCAWDFSPAERLIRP